MRKSILYFSITTGILACLLYFPSLTGSVIVDENEQPTDLLSKLWAGNKKISLTHAYGDNIRVLKIENAARWSTQVMIREGENKYLGGQPNNYKSSISGDTLILKITDGTYFEVQSAGNLKTVVISKTDARIDISNLHRFINIEATNSSNVMLNLPALAKEDTVARQKDLQLAVAGKSVLTLINGGVKNLQACVDNGELNYSNVVVIDSANVQLEGRSIVKSTAAESENKLKKLIVTGDTKYFKPELIGQNVQLHLRETY